jgi:gliding motility-associated protein GldE
LETDPLPYYLTVSGLDAQVHPVPTIVIAGILLIIILLIFSVLISGSEAAYWSLHSQNLLKTGKKNNYLMSFPPESPEKLLATVVVANNFISIFIIILLMHFAGQLIVLTGSALAGYLTAAVVLFILLLNEVLPKSWAVRHADRMVRITGFPLKIIYAVFYPLISALTRNASTNRNNHAATGISLDELSQALERSADNENAEEKEILEGIVRFGHKNVAEIMHSRVDVVALKFDAPFEKVIEVINESGYSRIPVYSGSFDHVKGILYIKDLLPFINDQQDFRWQSILRIPFFVPETKKIDDLLEEFRKNKVHMAIVVDEYGGSSGIVTMEDILEEIVGDIPDEFDEDEHYSMRLSENKYLFDGKIQLDDFCKFTGSDSHAFDDCKGEADTLAGLILEIKGEIPALNEKIRCKNFLFAIDAVDNRRIKKIKVEIT